MASRRVLSAFISALTMVGLISVFPHLATAAETSTSTSTATHGMDYRYVYIDTPGSRGDALGVSDDRTVVGFEIVNIGTERPFVFTEAGGTATLPLDPNMNEGSATRIAANGKTIAGWEEALSGECWAVRWTKNTSGAWSVQQLAYHYANDSNFVGCAYFPVGVGADGSVAIATGSGANAPQGLLWTPGGIQTFSGQPRAMSSTGEVVGTQYTGSTSVPWRSVGGALAAPAGSTSAEADGMAEDGTLIVTSNVGAYQTRIDGSYLPLQDLPASGVPAQSRARAISDHEEVVGDSNVINQGTGVLTHAVRWNSDGTVVDLNDVTPHDQNETLTAAWALDKGGDIVGGAMSDRTQGLEAPMLLVAMPPIIFVPGVAGSHLVNSFGQEEWINCLGVHDPLALPPDGDTNIHADAVLRNNPCIKESNDTKAYAPFTDYLEQHGMVEYKEYANPSTWTTSGCDTSQRDQHPNLFLFPYDWRFSNALSAQKLADFMGCVRKFYTGPVVVVAHSMGGLVSRRYILDHPHDTSHVRDLLTIGTPWLGAPKLVRAEETGEFIPLLMTTSTVKEIIPTMPGPGQLLPSPDYYDLAASPFREAGRDINGNGKAFETYTHDELDALLDAQYPNHAAISASASTFHAYSAAEGAQDDWNNDTTGVNYTVIYGIHQKTDTPGPVVANWTVSCGHAAGFVFDCTPTPDFKIDLIDGDGTVPVESSSRIGATDFNTTNHDHETLIPIFGYQQGDDTTEHTGLTRNGVVEQTVLWVDGRADEPGYIQSDTSPQSLMKPLSLARSATSGTTLAAPAQTHPQWNVEVVGENGGTTVTAPDGSTDATPVGVPRATLPDVTHVEESDDAEIDVLPDSGTYTVSFTAGAHPVQVDARHGAQDAPTQRSIWTDVPIPAGRTVSVTIGGAAPVLRYDADGDGTVDTTVTPTATPGGTQLADVTAPDVSLGSIIVNGQREYTINASDDGSGVKDVLWSADEHSFRPYDGPIAAGSASVLYAFAEDNAGNRSGMQELHLGHVTAGPYTTATPVPALPASGWSTQAVSVQLHAHPSDGTTIDSVTYSLGATTHVVSGDAATVDVTAPGGTLTYFATDSAGTKEPVQTLFVGVDNTAPTVSVTTPTSGAVVSSLPGIAGGANDNSGGSGVDTVTFALQRNGDGDYWNGSAWQSGQAWLATRAASGGGWQSAATMPSGAALTAGAYTVSARAVDVAGNAVTADAAVTVTSAATILRLDPPASYAAYGSYAFGVNDSGQVAGMVDQGTSYIHPPVRWDANGTPTALSTYSGSYTFDWTTAWAVSPQGVVVGRFPQQAGMWRADGSPVPLPGDTPGSFNSDTAQAISPTGVVAGEAGWQWAIWPTPSTVKKLPDPPGFPSAVESSGTNLRKIGGINTAGTVVATRWGNVSGAPGEPVAAMSAQTNGVYTSSYLFPPAAGATSATASGALAINTQGDVVGWGGTNHAPGSGGYTLFPPFLRKADGTVTWFDLGALQQSCGTATSVNDSDTVVGFGGQCPTGYPYEDLDGPGHSTGHRAWIVQDGVVKDLTSLLPAGSGWVLNEAWSISNTGRIAGTGTYNGVQRGFVLTLGAAAAADHAPLAADASATTAVGASVNVALSATDADSDPLTWSVVDQPSHGTTAAPAGATVTYTPAPGYVGTDTFTVRANDGTFSSNIATVTVTVGSPPLPAVPPTPTLTAPSEAVEGTPFVADGSDSAGPNGESLSYSWDLDGDGTFGDATTPTATVTVPDDGTRTIALRVSGASGAAITKRTVTIVNAAPVVAPLADSSIKVGEAATAVGSFTDPGADTWTATVDYGDGSGPAPLALDGKAFDLAHTYDKPGHFTLSVTVCDDDGGCGQQQAQVTVTGGVVTGAPVAVHAVEGASFDGSVASFTYSDPAAPTSGFHATIDWGDGTATSAGTVAAGDAGYTVAGKHTYADEGRYDIQVVVDADGGTGATVVSGSTVADAALTTATGQQLTSPDPLSDLEVAAFTDANPLGSADDFHATIAWGDGTTSDGTVATTGTGAYAVRGSHTYTTLGQYTVHVSITDVGGATASVTAPLVVYATTSGGSFTVGDRSAAPGAAVQFWGANWSKVNPTSNGSTPRDFTGFASGVAPAGCGDAWASGPAASTHPPATVPPYVAVVVTNGVTQNAAVLSGTVVHVVVVRTDPGYAPDIGHLGAGTIVATIC